MTQTSSPRNLLLVTFDQWRGDWCDPAAPVVGLPNIAQLAARGWSARRCYATCPQCVPVRISWLTGLYPSQLGVTTHRNVDLPPDAPSVIRALRERGWHTELIGKGHWTAHVAGRDLRDEEPRLRALGFDRALEIAGPRGLRHVTCALTDAWEEAGVLHEQRADLESRYGEGRRPRAWEVRPTVLPVELYPDVWLTGRAVERIADLPSDRPWLLWVSFVGPHEPFDTPAPWAGRHRAAPLPRPVPEPPWIRSLPAHAATRRTRERWEGLVTPDAIDACRRDYADHLSLLDDQVGRLVRAVEGRSDASRTAVAVTGDHGELLGDAGMLYKGTFLEGAVRVPWIHRPPPGAALPASATCARPLGVTALLGACLAHLAAGSAADDLMAWAEGAPDVCCEFEDELMIVDGPRKLVVDGKGRPLWATDLDRDPHEQENVITQLRAAWRADPGWRRLREMAHAQFRLRKRRGWTWRRLEDVR